MNQQMSHRYEAVAQPDGWAVEELKGTAVIGRTVGLSKRDALSEAVRQNRILLRDGPRQRSTAAIASSERPPARAGH